MKTYIVVIFFMIIGIATYAIFLTQSDISENIISKNFGTITTSLGSPFLGSSQAPITIIEFGNYQCEECQKWFKEIRPIIIKEYLDQGEINMIFIDTQLTKNIPIASFASYCANEQGKYWDFHERLFDSSIENKIDTIQIKQIAVGLEMNIDSFEECLNSKKYEKKVKYSTYEAKKNGINRLPTFIIIDSNGEYKKFLGTQSYSVFKEKIKSIQN